MSILTCSHLQRCLSSGQTLANRRKVKYPDPSHGRIGSGQLLHLVQYVYCAIAEKGKHRGAAAKYHFYNVNIFAHHLRLFGWFSGLHDGFRFGSSSSLAWQQKLLIILLEYHNCCLNFNLNRTEQI